MHAHATVVAERSLLLRIVLPRFYQLEQLIDKYRRTRDGKVIFESYMKFQSPERLAQGCKSP